MQEIITKKCTKCGEVKNINMFPKNRNKCLECVRQYHKQYYKDNTERLKRYREDNDERLKQYSKQWRKDNTERLKRRSKQYYEDNIERIKQYRKDNAERTKQQTKRYREENAEKIKQWYKTEKGKISLVNAMGKRRSLIRQKADGTLPLKIKYPLTPQLQELLVAQDYKCNKCGCDISEEKHLDHHVPLSKGGTHSIDNVVWLCPTCNLTKSATVPRELLLVGGA